MTSVTCNNLARTYLCTIHWFHIDYLSADTCCRYFTG